MKLVGLWNDGLYVKGKWVLPNGTYFDGSFTKSLPNGRGTPITPFLGKWVFTNENVVEGDYSQALEEKESVEGEKKPEVKLSWKTAANITNAAQKVNSTEAVNY